MVRAREGVARRLDRLEAQCASLDSSRVLKITVTRVGEVEETRELHFPEPRSQQRSWPWNRRPFND